MSHLRSRLPDSFQYHLYRQKAVTLARQSLSDCVHHTPALLGWSASTPPGSAPASRAMEGPEARWADTAFESIAIGRTPEDLAEAFPIQLAAAVSDGRLSQQDLDALCAMTMGRGDVRDADSARNMIIAQARALVPGVVIDANCALQS